MFSVLQTVDLADRCFLCELLYWAALKRFPLEHWYWDSYGSAEFRFSEACGLDTNSFIESPVTLAECEYAGVSPNPHYHAFLDYRTVFDESDLKAIESHIDRMSKFNREEFSDADRDQLISHRLEILEELKEVNHWNQEFHTYLEYFKSRAFVDLREGKICGFGVKLKGSSWEEILNAINDNETRLEKQDHVPIGQAEWILSKIDWGKSVLYGKECSYCWVNFNVEQMFSIYTVPDLPTIGSVEKLCDSYILDRQNLHDPPTHVRRGRPPLPWEQFHVEVAALVQKNALPEKKEAAIAHFEGWFRERLGISVSRSAIGQKLKPYYQRFLGFDLEKGRS
jgi:hypothetical protein